MLQWGQDGLAPGHDRCIKHLCTACITACLCCPSINAIQHTPSAPPAFYHPGKYYKPGTAPGPLDERKLYLHIQGEPESGCFGMRLVTLQLGARQHSAWRSGGACVLSQPGPLTRKRRSRSYPPAQPLPLAAGPSPEVVKRAKQEIKRILEESTEKAMRREAPAAGRYSVM